MELLIWIGAIIALLGVAGLVRCIFSAARARREDLPERAMKARLQTIVAWNMAALAVSAIGLMMVVIGILLG